MSKHRINIILYKVELVRYIKELAYIVSKSGAHASEDGTLPEYKIADILDKEDGGSDGNWYIGMRALNYAISKLMLLCAKHSEERERETASTNAFCVRDHWHITLMMESRSPQALANALQESMTRYIALLTIGEWCKLTGSEYASVYIGEAEEVRGQIAAALNPPTRKGREVWPAW